MSSDIWLDGSGPKISKSKQVWQKTYVDSQVRFALSNSSVAQKTFEAAEWSPSYHSQIEKRNAFTWEKNQIAQLTSKRWDD